MREPAACWPAYIRYTERAERGSLKEHQTEEEEKYLPKRCPEHRKKILKPAPPTCPSERSADTALSPFPAGKKTQTPPASL